MRTTPGLFRSAHGGTLLLDEISEVSPGLQAKLLRVLQEREVRSVGGTSPVPVDVRVVATTNRDLGADVRNGRFRPDLYHRLNVVRIEIPPLRERADDVAPLTDELLTRKAREHARPRPVRVEDLGLESAAAAAGPLTVGTTLRDAERTLVIETLRSVRGNRTRAAEILGISVRTVRNKLREYRASGHWNEDRP